MPINLIPVERCPKILQKLVFFYTFLLVFFPVSISQSQVFEHVDLGAWLSKHPLMQQYDQDTKRFRGTPSEIVPASVFKQDIEALSAEISTIEKQKSSLTGEKLLDGFDSPSEVDFWQQIRSVDEQLLRKRQALVAKENLLTSSSDLTLQPLAEIARQFQEEFASTSSTVVLNSLPNLPTPLPDFPAENQLLNFLENGSKADLEAYYALTPFIGKMFQSVFSPIIYQKNEKD